MIGIGTDFTACTVLPTLADGTPLCELRRVSRPPARLREAVEAPRRPGAGRPHQRRSPQKRGEPGWPATAARSPRSGSSRRALQLLEEDPEVYDRGRAVDRGRRLDRVAAVRQRDPQRVHGRVQGHPPGRAPTPRGTTWPRSNPAFAGFTATSSTARSASSATGPARSPREAAGWTGLPEGIAVAVGNVDAHVTAPAAAGHRAGPHARDHGHLDLPRDERRRAARRCPGMCGVVRRRDHRRARGATRPGRAGSATSSAGSSSTASRRSTTPRRRGRGGPARAPHRAGRSSSRSASTAWWRWTGTAATARCWSTTSSSRLIVGLTLATRARGRLPGAAGVRPRSAPARSSRRSRTRACPSASSSIAGGLLKNRFLMQIYADVTGYAARRHRLQPGPRAGLGHPRRRRRRRLRRHRRRPAARWASGWRRLRARPGQRRRYDELYADYVELYDHFGRDSELLHRLRDRRDAVL